MSLNLLPEPIQSDSQSTDPEEEFFDLGSSTHKGLSDGSFRGSSRSKKDSEDLDLDEEAGPDQDEEEIDMARLLRENSESDDDDDDEITITEGQPSVHIHRKRKGNRLLERPIRTVAVLMIACWTLRVPVMSCDFLRSVLLSMREIYSPYLYIRLIEAYRLPYLDPVARGLIPEKMVQHLNKQAVQALSPYVCPTCLKHPLWYSNIGPVACP
jgi:RNA polymerase I-specific transcription initiation factor RRN7